MRRGRIAVSAAAAAAAAALAAGCGGSSSAEVTTTVTTGTAPATTAPATTAAGTTASPATTTAATIGAASLPPQDAIPGVTPGTIQQLPSAQAFVDALYQASDPVKPKAVERLETAGYAGGALRDQTGQDPSAGIALFRSYSLKVRDHAAAQGEVDDAVDEVKAQTSAPTTDVDVPDIPGARALHVEVDQGGVKGKVAFVTFAAGDMVYGLQGVSTNDATLPQDEIIGAARDLYEKVTAAP